MPVCDKWELEYLVVDFIVATNSVNNMIDSIETEWREREIRRIGSNITNIYTIINTHAHTHIFVVMIWWQYHTKPLQRWYISLHHHHLPEANVIVRIISTSKRSNIFVGQRALRKWYDSHKHTQHTLVNR